MRTHAETTDAEQFALVDTLRTAGLNGLHLEIGTAAGGTLVKMMNAYPASNRPKFVVIDPMTYFDGQKDAIDANLGGSCISPTSVDFRITTSGEAFQRASAAKERFAFIFIDAVHLADYVMQDLRWTTLLQVGGLVALHDHSPEYPGVMWAVRHFLKKNTNYKVVARAESLIILKKIGPSPNAEVGYIDLLKSCVVAVPFHWRRMWKKKRRISVPSSV